jgi:hypothetical protein
MSRLSTGILSTGILSSLKPSTAGRASRLSLRMMIPVEMGTIGPSQETLMELVPG